MEYLTSLIATVIAHLHLFLNNWSIAILALALVIRVLLFPIQIFNFKQQRLLRKIQPQLDLLTEKYKDEPLVLMQKMSELKKQEGVKTGMSLLSSFVQMPLFISIYKVFSSLQALMGGSFAWISSLGAPDPLFIFPALVGLTTFLQQKMNPAAAPTGNPGISTMMKWMPAVSMVFMVGLPSGLVIYYAASGFLQLVGDFVLRKVA